MIILYRQLFWGRGVRACAGSTIRRAIFISILPCTYGIGTESYASVCNVRSFLDVFIVFATRNEKESECQKQAMRYAVHHSSFCQSVFFFLHLPFPFYIIMFCFSDREGNIQPRPA